MVLLYDSKFTEFSRKFHMHWLGPYVIKEIMDGGTVQFTKLNGDPFSGRVNGSQLKLYIGDPTQRLYGRKTILVLQAVVREHGTINYTAKVEGLCNRWATWKMVKLQYMVLHAGSCAMERGTCSTTGN